MPSEVSVRLAADQEYRFDLSSAEPMAHEAARLWLDEQFTALQCEPIRLTATEAMLMRIFAAHAHEPVTRIELVENLGGGDAQSQERAVDVQITRLRRKIEIDPRAPRYLQTVRGSGYMLAPD